MSSALVVDACVALKWFVAEQDAVHARRLLTSGTILYGPDTVVLEVANGLWKNARLGRIQQDAARIAIEALPSFFADFVPFAEIRATALDLSLSLDHPIYDCAYLTVARALGCRMITTDEKLAGKAIAAGQGDHIVLLSDWSP